MQRSWPCLARRTYHELSYLNPGDPSQVLSVRSAWDPEPPVVTGPTPVLRVAMLAAPWNPADAMGVQGRYPSPYQTGAAVAPSAASLIASSGTAYTVAGSEGLGQVVDVIPGTTAATESFQVGDYVVPAQPGLGLYRSTVWAPDSAWIRLARGAELLVCPRSTQQVAPVFQTGGTALGMLRSVPLEAGDVVVQNAGNSAVGIMVSQWAATMGVHCVSLVRPGESGSPRAQRWHDVVEYLTRDGKNSLVWPDDFDATLDSLKASLSTISPRPPRLAINAVGGTSASTLLSLLGPSGTMITYGGMSRHSVSVSTTQLIFQNVHLTGYWHSRWMACESTPLERSKLMNALVDGVLDGAVTCPPVQSFALSNFRDAFEFERQQSNEPIRRKVVFDCQE